MVRIAIAGGSGNVALEVIDALVAAKKHEILVLSREDPPAWDPRVGAKWVKTNYQDCQGLTEILNGVHTVLSFVVVQSDPGEETQRNLIDAAIQAGVKRFAPSEWANAHFEHLPWYAGKAEIRKYLEQVNQTKESAEHFRPFETQIDFHKRRALMLEGGGDDLITLTTAQDLANVVARAVAFEGKWPVVGGIKGTDISIKDLLALGENVRGGPFDIEMLKADDLKAGVTKSSWLPIIDYPGFTPAQAKALASQLLSDYRFTSAEDFLTKAWHGKL